MKKITAILVLAVLTAYPAFAADKDEIMTVLHQWNDDSSVACADEASVIDDVPPFEWHGVGACAKWKKDYDAFMKKEGVTDATGTIGAPEQLVVLGDRAYAVVPATFGYTNKGKPVKLTATATFALRKTSSGWRITGWAWGTHASK